MLVPKITMSTIVTKKGLQKLSDANDYHLPIVFQVTAWNPELTMHWI